MFTFKGNDGYNDGYNFSFRNCSFNKHGNRVYVHHFMPIHLVF